MLNENRANRRPGAGGFNAVDLPSIMGMQPDAHQPRRVPVSQMRQAYRSRFEQMQERHNARMREMDSDGSEGEYESDMDEGHEEHDDGRHRSKREIKNIKNALPIVKFDPAQFKEADKRECRICMNEFTRGEELRLLQCFHHFHKQCIDSWFDRSVKCPLCNTI